MQLKVTNLFGPGVFDRGTVEKVGETADVIGVSIDGGLGQMSDLHITGHPHGDFGETILVRSHAAVLESARCRKTPACTASAKAQGLTTETFVTTGS
jgi:hypothetical protein